MSSGFWSGFLFILDIELDGDGGGVGVICGKALRGNWRVFWIMVWEGMSEITVRVGAYGIEGKERVGSTI